VIGAILAAVQLVAGDCRLPVDDCRLAAPNRQSSIANRQSAMVDDSIPTLTLADALQRALHLDPGYVRALGSVSEADWTRKAARVAFFAPSLTAGLDATFYSVDFFNIGTGAPTNRSVNFRADARYELFSARKFAELGRSQAELESATAGEVKQRYLAALFTESAYYGVLADQELARVARDRKARAEQQLVLARARVASGAAVQTDSLQVRLELARAEVDLLRLETALRVSQLELGRRVGLSGPAQAAALEGAPSQLPLTLDQAIARALEQGPDYRAARAQERAADKVLLARRGEYLPTVAVSASHTRFDVQFFPSARNVSSLTFSVSLPIWNNGDRELRVIQARADRNVARALRADLERAAARDVTAAYDGYETARAAVAVADRAVLVGRENYRVQEARYRAGATTVLDLITAQNSLSDAESELVQAYYTARVALAQLEAILGVRLMTPQGGGQ
jgi:outer membrane protein TolC